MPVIRRNPLNAWLGYTQGNNCGSAQNQSCDPGAIGYDVYQVDMGSNELQPVNNPTKPILSLSSGAVPTGFIIAAFLGQSNRPDISTAQTGAGVRGTDVRAAAGHDELKSGAALLLPFPFQRHFNVRFAFIGSLFPLLAAWGCATSPSERAARFLRTGEQYMARKDYSRAELEFRNACRPAPQNAEAAYQLGLGYLGHGDLNHGIAALFHALQLDPNHAGANVKIADLMATSSDSGLAKRSEQWMNELLKQRPGNVEALNALAEMQSGDGADAEKNLKSASERLPGNCRQRRSGGLHHYQEPRSEVRQFLAIRPEAKKLRQRLADVRVTHAARETTGSYWKPVFKFLAGGFTVYLANPVEVKNRTHKTVKRTASGWRTCRGTS